MTNRIDMFKGDNNDLKVTVKGKSSGLPIDITGTKLIFTTRTSDKSINPLFQRKNTAAGGDNSQIEMTNPTAGEFKVHIIPTNTSNLASGSLVYDIQLELSPYGIKTIIKDTFNLKEDVTK